MAVIVYEGMFILDSNRFGRDHETVSGQIPTMVEKLGGEMLVSRLWEERRLAYPIKGHRKGAYWLTYFRLEGSRLRSIRGKCQISEDIVRVLFLEVDPRIVDTLVAHARAGTIPPTCSKSTITNGAALHRTAVSTSAGPRIARHAANGTLVCRPSDAIA